MSAKLRKYVMEAKEMMGFLWKAATTLALCYLLYILIGSTLPWLPMVRGRGDEDAVALEPAAFSGTGNGPDRVALVELPQDGYNVRIAMLRAAQRTADIVYYAIQDDASGQAFLGEVLGAADRGVAVRILLDGKINNGKGIQQYLEALETHPNITCRRFNPMHWLKPWTWHAILHNKIILVDGTHLLTGGRNVGDRFFAVRSLTGAVTYDRDVFVTAGSGEGSVLAEARAFLDRLWDAPANQPEREAKAPQAGLDVLRAAALRMEADNPGHYEKILADYTTAALPARRVTLLTNPIHTAKKTSPIAQALYALAEGAESSVMIQTPYATANRAVLRALSAIDAKAETFYLTNSMASSPNFFAFSNYYANRRRFLRTGIDIYELQSGDSMHHKSMVVDSHLSMVGTMNLDDRSLFIDTENMLVIDSEPFAAELRGAMERYQAASLQVGADNRYLPGAVEAQAVSRIKQAGMGFVSVFSRLFQFLI